MATASSISGTAWSNARKPRTGRPMLPLYRTLSLRYLSRRWFRALLIVASIALGVATLVATRTLNDTMARAVVASSNPLAGIVDLIVNNAELRVARGLA